MRPSGFSRQAQLGTRQTPGRLKPKEVDALLHAMQNVNISEGQSMEVLRLANRVPLQFQHAACAITQTVTGTNWRSYGLEPITRQPAQRARDR